VDLKNEPPGHNPQNFVTGLVLWQMKKVHMHNNLWH